MSENTATSELLPIAPKGFDIRAAAELGARAEGAELVTIETNEQMVGLPKSVPALLTRVRSPASKAFPICSKSTVCTRCAKKARPTRRRWNR